MSKSLSLFLEVVRITAALLVVLHHGAFEKFGTAIPSALAGTRTEPVVVFFVLSGFVIAYTAEAKDLTLRDFATSRFARIASVAFPAIVMTYLCDLIGSRIDPALYADHWHDPATLANLAQSPWITYAATASFINGFWQLDYWPGTNSPFWSLSYEVAYYVLFAFAFYLRGVARIVLLAIGLIAIGPKIWLLAPVWLMGVATWQTTKRIRILPAFGWLLVIASLGMYAAFLAIGGIGRLQGIFLRHVPHVVDFGLASFALSNYVSGFLFSMLVLGFAGAQTSLEQPLAALARPIRALAAMTFTAYLFHYPFLYLFAAISRRHSLGPIFVLGCLCIAIYLASEGTEKLRNVMRTRIMGNRAL